MVCRDGEIWDSSPPFNHRWSGIFYLHPHSEQCRQTRSIFGLRALLGFLLSDFQAFFSTVKWSKGPSPDNPLTSGESPTLFAEGFCLGDFNSSCCRSDPLSGRMFSSCTWRENLPISCPPLIDAARNERELVCPDSTDPETSMFGVDWRASNLYSLFCSLAVVLCDVWVDWSPRWEADYVKSRRKGWFGKAVTSAVDAASAFTRPKRSLRIVHQAQNGRKM